jgi:putative membrane protein
MKITHWLISTLAILIAAYLLPGVTATLIGALIFAVVLGLINMFIKPIVFILTLPINIVTLGIFSLFINGLLVLFASEVVPGFKIDGYWTAFWFSILLSIINALFGPAYREANRETDNA